ncbi:hypothetical protein N8I77_012342 [Diaporthe amygdali]|uniref:Helicase C-terminal domain-containing protein n=1 Tax=Phomopsis amygdali TaxID=1214568 RepID=A0AAD9S2M2_PHOAM|nr:hypothetical protein N8I77_012342 [Diaporthe amygdali]
MIGLDDGDSRPCPKRQGLNARLGTPIIERLGDGFQQKNGCSSSLTFTFPDLAITKASDEKECLLPQQVRHGGDESKTSSGGEIVCFGMLCDIKCQFTTCQGSQVANVLREIRKQTQTLHISKLADTWAIYSSENVMLGVMNDRTASKLASLPSEDQLAYEAFMESSKLGEAVDAYLKGTKNVKFDIVVNIMGPESISEAVGQQLSERRMFLQRPYQLPEGTTYINPQYLAIDDAFEDELGGYYSEGGEGPRTDSLDGDHKQLSAHDDPNDELWNIIDNSSVPEGMARIEVDQNIHTVLMEHQRDVVDFIIARERGIATRGRRLWTEELTDDGLVVFRHKITGVPSPAPTDVSGGILADDMGLGKTLSMISTIVTTLDFAKSHVDLCDAERKGQLKPTPATLVIVPSALLLDNWLEEITNLIFSFWKKTLDSISDALENENVRFARVDGSLSQSQRKRALQSFRSDQDTKVLLVTFGTGSTGLNNLCIATRIHIFEPQWNPTVESQAIGRLFRHGQTNKVKITRYICQNTVEEAVESRQLRKVELAHRGGLDGSRNDRSPVKARFMALRDYIESYMASNDFKDIDQ